VPGFATTAFCVHELDIDQVAAQDLGYDDIVDAVIA
jgi:hypothetical protein